MTDFTLSSGSICQPYRSPWGSFPIKTMSVSTGISSATIFPGAVLTLDWSGSTVAGRVLPSTAGSVGGPHFMTVGIAASGVSGSTALAGGGTTVEIWEANPLVEFKAVTKGNTLQSSHVGLCKKLAKDSTLNIAYVDLTASTASDWRVVITDLINAEGDSGGYVAFKFLSRLTENIGSSIALTSTTAILAFYR